MDTDDDNLVEFQFYGRDEMYVSLYESEVVLEIDLEESGVYLNSTYGDCKLDSYKLRKVQMICELLEDNISVFERLDVA